MAMVKVVVTSALATYMNNEKELTVEARNVKEVIEKLVEMYGKQLAVRLLDEEGNLRRYVNVYVNDRNVRSEDVETELKDGDEVLILPAVSGG